MNDQAVQEFPASFAQERLWFVTQLAPQLAVYNIVFPASLPAGLDLDLFRRALAGLVARHEPLRTALASRDGRLVQVVHTEVPVELAVTVLDENGGRSADEVRSRIDRVLADDGARPFDLERAPLWRARVFRLPDDEWVFGFVVHHSVFDAQSVHTLLHDLAELYQAEVDGRPATLPELQIQYADFASWQRDQVDGGELDAQLEYWRTQLAGIPPEIGLPTDRPRPPRASHRGADLWFEVPAEVNRAVSQLARTAATTRYAVLLAAFTTLLSRLSGQTDVVVGCPVAGRAQPELEPLLGMFVNTLVLRTDCAGAPTFRELVSRTTDTVQSALEHTDLPFDRLVEVLAPERDAARSPLYQVVLNNLPSVGAAQTGNGTAKVDLIVDLAGGSDGVLHGRLEYATDLFDATTAEAMPQRFTQLLGAALADPDSPIDRLPLLLDGERDRLRTAARPARILEPAHEAGIAETVWARFERVAAATPGAVAVCDSTGGRHTYAELRGAAARLANRLTGHGAGPDRPVAVLFDNTVDLAVAVLGVLGSGAAYLPVDVEHPPDRIAYLLADAGAVAAVTTDALAERLSGTAVPVIRRDDPADPPTAPSDAGRVPPAALAYLIYTSGSTGRPKGVGVSHGNLLAYLDGLTAMLAADGPAVWTLLQPLTFDFGITTFFGALLTGGTLHLVGRELATDAEWIARHLRRDEVDYLKITPSHLSALADALDTRDAELVPRRALLLGGEATHADRFARWRELAGDRGVINHYGPTETTVGVVALPAGRPARPRGQLTPIGWPMAHAEVYVLDERGELVPDGVVGELCIGGDAVTRGYLGRPGLTADRFVPDPYSDRPGRRLYRTGDLARRLPDGAIEFLGRADDQVKVRGYRVELGEVQAALVAHPAVGAGAVVAATPDTAEATDAAPDGGPAAPAVELVGYLVPAAGRSLDLDAVRAHVAATLPEYMIPGTLVVLDELPLTPHGKLDRARLPVRPPAEAAGGGTEVSTPDAPVGEFEEAVAGLFRVLLRRDHIGRTDDFMALGGHSLLAIQLMTRIRKTLGVALPLPLVFEEPTVANLAAAVAARLQSGELPPIKPAPPGEAQLASYGEQRLWFLDQLNPDATLHNVQYLRRLTGQLDQRALEGALRRIVRRHQVLATRFVVTPDGLTRDVAPEPELPFSVVDLTGLEPDAREAERQRLLDEHGGHRFDLATELPVRALLIRLGDQAHQLLLTVHHAVFDGPSVEVLSGELAELYPALRDGREPQLPDLPVQYGDFAAWQRAMVTGELADTQLAYWRRQLDGLPDRLELPTDRPRPERIGVSGDHVRFAVSGVVVDALRSAGAAEGATLFMATLACYVELLRRHGDQRDLAVGIPMITRQRPELEPLIGFFVNTLVLRFDAGGEPTFRELLRQARRVTVEAYTNADVPFEVLVDELAPDRDPSVTPLVQTMFMLADDQRALPLDLGGVTAEFEPFGVGTAKFDLFLYLWRQPEGLSCVAEYRPELFDDSTIRALVGEYTDLLAAAAANPDSPLSELATGTDEAKDPADDVLVD